ncbi:MAG TPA: hypothetical protein VF430_02840, partial [Verrucomicrobiae bacterium]|jgi:hypothetical protein
MGKRVVMIRDSVAPGCPFPYQHPDWAVTPMNGRDVSSVETGAVIEVCAQILAKPAGQASI